MIALVWSVAVVGVWLWARLTGRILYRSEVDELTGGDR